MQISELTIKNYRSFDVQGQTIYFPAPHCALVGRNNSGKSNILNALNILFRSQNPNYANFEEYDFFDSGSPIELLVKISRITEEDGKALLSLPNITKQQQGALFQKIKAGSAEICFLLRKRLGQMDAESSEEIQEGSQDTFEITLWGFTVHRKREDARKAIVRMLMVPAVRDSEKELSASKWTAYGQLMKLVLENSDKYSDIQDDLSILNQKIQEVFKEEKEKLLRGAQVVSSVEDISFQLTKENSPSELLRNLEIFVTDNSKKFNIENVGTGTQSAIIIGILELALKAKSSKIKLFCIEEPEAFIHPHGIRYLGRLIKDIAKGQNTQVIISTHSLSLVSNFQPDEIIRIDKRNGKTVVRQDVTLSDVHLKRFIHQDNAEIFFSDRVILVEGATEKHLLSKLDKLTKQDESNPGSDDCDLDRVNVGIIRLDSVDCILNYIKILSAFKIAFVAIVDKDFIGSNKKRICEDLCKCLGISYQCVDISRLVQDFKAKNIFVNTKGEIEDLFPDQEIANITGKTVSIIQEIKAKYPEKTSKAFKEIFNMGKVEYSIEIAQYYADRKQPHPLEAMIRHLYLGTVQNIIF